MNTDAANHSPTDDILAIRREAHGVVRVILHTPSLADHETPGIAERVLDTLDDIDGDGVRLVFDLSAVEFLNSMGLGMLINMRNRMHDRRGETILLGPSEHLCALLELVRASRLFHIFEAEEMLQNHVQAN